MSGFLKKLLFASAILGLGLNVVACGDDDDVNENDTPEIFTEIAMMWDAAGCVTTHGVVSCEKSCATISSQVINKTKMDRDVVFKSACEQYKQSLKNNGGKASNLSEDMDNSGFYLSAYMLANSMQKEFYVCSATDGVDAEKVKRDWEAMFKEKGCDNFLTDAETIVKSRGK